MRTFVDFYAQTHKDRQHDMQVLTEHLHISIDSDYLQANKENEHDPGVPDTNNDPNTCNVCPTHFSSYSDFISMHPTLCEFFPLGYGHPRQPLKFRPV